MGTPTSAWGFLMSYKRRPTLPTMRTFHSQLHYWQRMMRTSMNVTSTAAAAAAAALDLNTVAPPCRCYHHQGLYQSYIFNTVMSPSAIGDSIKNLSTLSITRNRRLHRNGAVKPCRIQKAPSRRILSSKAQSHPPEGSNSSSIQMKQPTSTANVLNDYMKQRNRLKPYQVAAVWKNLEKSVQAEHDWQVRRNFWIIHETYVRALFIHTMQSVNDLNGRSTATLTHSLVKLASLTSSSGNTDIARVEPLWNALLARTAVHLKLDGFNAQQISNLLWAYAKANKRKIDPVLLNELADIAMRRVDEFNEQGLSNVAWAFATLNQKAPSLFDAIAKAAPACIADFTAQGLSNTVWAFATLEHEAPLLFDDVAKNAQKHISKFNPQGFANTVWAFATMSHQKPALFDAISKTAHTRIDDFNPQNLANTAWAFATLNYNAPLLFDAIAKAAQEHIDNFNPQNLANTAWAYATLNQEAPSLFDAISKTAHTRIDDFKHKELSNTAWAFATLNHDAPSLFDAIAKAGQECIGDFNPQSLANTAWAFATLNYNAPLLFDAIAKAAQEHIDNFNPQNLANTAWAFAVLNVDTNLLTDTDLPFMQTLLTTDPTSFNVENLCQLHQFHLWCKEKNMSSWFPDELIYHCLDTFVSREEKSSRFQKDVVTCLETLQGVSQVQEEVRTNIGYSLDTVVDYHGVLIGVEVDGPSHFVGRSQSPNGKTVLKHRQLCNLEGWKLVSVPYWEWNEIMKNSSGTNAAAEKKQAYLQKLLDGAS